MPFLLSNESQKKFHKERTLILESFLTLSGFETFKRALSSAQVRRDLFRTQLDLKKVLLKKDFQLMVCTLCNAHKLFYAFDQLLDKPLDPGSLQERVSIHPLKLGGLLCWQGESTHPLFPTKPNDLLLFDPQLILPWNELPPGQRFYLFGLSPTDAVYQENAKDPFTNDLKRLNYQNNQPLSIKTHPLLKG